MRIATAAALLALTAAPALAQDMEGMEGMGDHHAGHAMPDQPAPPPAADPHAGHAMHGMDRPATGMPDTGEPPSAAPPPEALSGPAHAADSVFPPARMAAARAMLPREMGAMTVMTVRFDRLEAQSAKGADMWLWDGDIRYGGDIDKLWLKSEGHGRIRGGVEDADVQALWSHALDPWFDLQAGVRQEFRRGPDRTQLTLGVQGLAPYVFELDAAAFLSTKGELTARIEAEYDQRLTRRLILQPRVEANLSAQAVPELGLGTGVTSLQAGVRLRYEIAREFAPYIGVEWQRDLGRTADFTRAEGEDASRTALVAGVRFWF